MDFYAARRATGREKLAGLKGPVILVANHASHMDTPVILAALPWRLRKKTAVAAAADYFYKNRLVAAAVSLVFNTVPIERRGGGMGKNGSGHLDKLLDQGWNLLLFPEGTRTRDGGPGRVRRGAAVLAAAHNLSIVPIRVTGTRAAMPPGRLWPKRLHGKVFSAATASTCPSASRSARCEDTTALIERVQNFFDNGDGGPSPSPYRRKKLVGAPSERIASAAGGRPRPTSGSPPQPGSSWRQREVHLSDGARMVVDRACLAGRWGIAGDGAGDEHDQAGRLQAPRPRAHGQDGRVLHRGAGAAARAVAAGGRDAARDQRRLDGAVAAADDARRARRRVARRAARGAGARCRRRGAARRAGAASSARACATSRSATPRSPPAATASTCCGSRPTSTTSCRSPRSWPGSPSCACPPSASRSSASASTSASRTSAAWASCAPISSRACPRPRRSR